MKKLYVLLSYFVCLSSIFAAEKIPSSDFDDCSRALSPVDKGLFAPKNTPQTRPQPAPQHGQEIDSLMQLLLPAAEQGDGGVSAGAPQDPLKADETVVDVPLTPVTRSKDAPELKIRESSHKDR